MSAVSNVNIQESTEPTYKQRIEEKKIERGILGCIWGYGENAVINVACAIVLVFGLLICISYINGKYSESESMLVVVSAAFGFLSGRHFK